MSYVTGFMLVCSLSEELQWAERPPGNVELINRWLVARNFAPLRDTCDHAVGSKRPQALVYTAGYNRLPEDQCAGYFTTLDWEEPDRAVLILQPEDGTTRVFRPPHEPRPYVEPPP